MSSIGGTLTSRKRASAREDAPAFEVPSNVPANAIVFMDVPFKYNALIAPAIGLATAAAVAFAGQSLMYILMISSMIMYASDIAGLQTTTLASCWIGAVLSVVSVVMQSLHLFKVSIFNVALVYCFVLFAFSAAAWVSLQFRFLRKSSPRVVLMFERSLFAVLPVCIPAILTWVAVWHHGTAAAGFIYMFVAGAAYFIFSLPTTSSFRKARTASASEDNLVLGKPERTIHTLHLLLAPIIIDGAVNFHHLFSSLDEIAQSVILLVVPLAFVAILAPLGSLAFLYVGDKAASKFAKPFLAVLAVVFVLAFQIRVVEHGLADILSLSPSLGRPLMGVANVLLAAAFALHYTGLAHAKGGSAFANTLLYACTVVASILLSIALSVPWTIKPFVVAAGVIFASFYATQSFPLYAMFVACTSVAGLWFIRRTFWWVDFEFEPLPMSLFHISLILLLEVVLSLVLPAVFTAPAPKGSNAPTPTVRSLLFAFHALILLFLEGMLNQQGIGVYPIELVIATTAVGLIVTSNLFAAGQLTHTLAGVAADLYLAKPVMVFHPTPLVLLCGACMYVPFGVSEALGLISKGEKVKADVDLGIGSPTHSPLPFMGVARVSVFAVVSIIFRHSLPAAALTAVMPSMPSEASLIGVVLLCIAACVQVQLPSASAGSSKRRSLSAALAASGCALMLFQPDLEFLGGFLTLRGLPHKATAHSGNNAFSFLLVLALGVQVAMESFIQKSKGGAVQSLRPLASALSGGLLGVYLSFRYFPSSGITMMFLLVQGALFMMWTSAFLSDSKTPGLPMEIMTGLIQLLSIISILIAPLSVGSTVQMGAAERLEILRSGLLAIWVFVNATMAVLIKLRKSVSSRPGFQSAEPWLPIVGNVCTILAVVLASVYNIAILEGSEACIYLLAPMLLLLHQDGFMFPKLTMQRRYFPVVLCSSLFMIARASFILFGQPLLASLKLMDDGEGIDIFDNGMGVWVRNIVALVMTFPNHILAIRFLWNLRSDSLVWLAVATPLQLPALLLTDLDTTLYLAGSGILLGGAHWWLSGVIRKQGMAMI